MSTVRRKIHSGLGLTKSSGGGGPGTGFSGNRKVAGLKRVTVEDFRKM